MQLQMRLRLTSRWHKYFGHLVADRSFNWENFQLGAEDPGDEAEEFGFDKPVTDLEALVKFKEMGRTPASLWAQARYLEAHPWAQKDHSLVGIGAMWVAGEEDSWFPVYYTVSSRGRDCRCVDLHHLGDEDDARQYDETRYRFLLKKEKSA